MGPEKEASSHLEEGCWQALARVYSQFGHPNQVVGGYRQVCPHLVAGYPEAARRLATNPMGNVVIPLLLQRVLDGFRGDSLYDITRFSLADMTRCGATLRRMGEDSTSMEDVAGKMVQYLYHEMTDRDSGERSFGLVRIFKTHDYGDLDSQLQGIVVKVLGREPESPGTKCLTLLATVTSMNNVSFGRGPCAPPCRLTLGRSDLWRVAKPYCRKGAPMSLQCRAIGLVHGAKATHSCALETRTETPILPKSSFS